MSVAFGGLASVERNDAVDSLRYCSAMPRSIFAPAFALFVTFGAFSTPGLFSVAFAAPTPAGDADAADAVPAKNAGSIDGRVASINYKTGEMMVEVGQGGSKRTYDVVVVPGTNIQGNGDFHTIADLKKGAHVQVLMSQHGSTYTAQIIRLL
jgi:hypothetical protein